MSRWRFWWRVITRTLWFRVSVYAGLGIVAALAAVVLAPLVPDEMAERIGGYDTVEGLLRILASSLLAVATFSIGAMVSSYTAVSSSVTPRVAAIVTDDPQTQNALATFVGGFLFSIVALVAVEASYYGAEGRAIIYLATLVMIGLVALALVTWIGHLGRLARLSYMVDRVESLSKDAFEARIASPWLGGRRWEGGAPPAGAEIRARRAGHVLNVDVASLEAAAAEAGGEVVVLCTPGRFVAKNDLLAVATGRVEAIEPFAAAFTVSPNRSFDQDPRYGLAVLGEIAARALSPAVNDPATAASTVGAGLRLLQAWADRELPDHARCARVLAPGLDPQGLIDDVFGPASRYGASDPVLAEPLLRALTVLADSPDRDLAQAASVLADETLARVRQSSMEPRWKTVCEACLDTAR
ncbi:DUF2254 domain-containing protein [Brevundimonas sp.]|uniref:DUF2254 domain-containing protein n=1 Tax=Brevundimonas sp. TaxID=1871086 RepID=UPI0035B48AD7